jgi:hypothetical protein
MPRAGAYRVAEPPEGLSAIIGATYGALWMQTLAIPMLIVRRTSDHSGGLLDQLDYWPHCGGDPIGAAGDPVDRRHSSGALRQATREAAENAIHPLAATQPGTDSDAAASSSTKRGDAGRKVSDTCLVSEPISSLTCPTG